MYELSTTDAQWQAIRSQLAAGGITALGACIFAGGFSWGMEQAGFNIAGHFELPELKVGARVSRQRWPVVAVPAQGEELSWATMARDLRRDGLVPQVLYANPPCAAFAKTGVHRRTSDARMCYLRNVSYQLGLDLQPTVWCWELVAQVWTMSAGFVEAMAHRANQQGYHCYAVMSSALLHGGFQSRTRFHFFASRVKLDFPGGLATDAPIHKGWRPLQAALDLVNDATEPLTNHQLEPDTSAMGPLLQFCPPGRALHYAPPSILRNHYRPAGVAWDPEVHGRPGFSWLRPQANLPCPAVLGGGTLIHPAEDRFMTVRELATVMGFPLTYRFSQAETTAYGEVGRGLCTHTASFMGRVIRRGLDADQGVSKYSLDYMDLRNLEPTGKLSQKSSLAQVETWWAKRHPSLPFSGWG